MGAEPNNTAIYENLMKNIKKDKDTNPSIIACV